MTTAVASKEVEPREYRWTVDALYRAIDAGIFPEPIRLELIHGRIIENMVQTPPRVSTRIHIARLLCVELESKFYVCERSPIRLSFDGEPTPDIIVVTGKAEDYTARHPVPYEVVMLIEVSDTTAAYDLGEKALLYAQAGIIEYWVVLPEEMVIVVHRDPAPDGYQAVTRFGMDRQISPLVTSDVSLMVHDLLGITVE